MSKYNVDCQVWVTIHNTIEANDIDGVKKVLSAMFTDAYFGDYDWKVTKIEKIDD